MNWIAELLPLIFVRWYSQRYLERWVVEGKLYARPRYGVLIRVKHNETMIDLKKRILELEIELARRNAGE